MRPPTITAFCAAFSLLSQCGCGSGSSSPISKDIGISASSDSVRPGGTVALRLQGTSQITGQWTLITAASGSHIDQSGLFTAPEIVPDPNTVSVGYVTGPKTLSYTITILNPVPIVESVLPGIIQRTTTQISVAGKGFVKGSTLLINGQSVQTTFISSTSLLTWSLPSYGSVRSLTVSVHNPAPGMADSSSVGVPVAVETPAISPASLAGGDVSLTVSGASYPAGLNASLDGRPMKVVSRTDSGFVIQGYLPPWHTGNATLQISTSTGVDLADIQIPISPTLVSFDTAARFLMQAGFGPRPDLVAHVQQIGLEAFIDEQFSMAPQPYSPTGAGMIDIVNRSVYGPNPLRLRVAWALQSFLTRTGIVLQTSNFPFEEKMEKDASANYRDILTDLASDVSVAFFLNLAGNAAPSDPTIHPNQNFARELLQLFSLGTDQLNEDGSLQTDGAGRPIPAYDQGTILDLSRAFTGWNYAPPSNSGYILYGLDWSVPLRADESQHDHGQKVLFGTVVLPAGQSAIQDRAAAMDAIFNHPNLPPFVSRILIQRLVKSDPSKDYVKRIASVFKDNGKGIHGDMAAVIKAILLDQEARSGDAGQSSSDGFLQEPYIFQTSVMNIIGVKTTDAQSSYLPCTLKECIFYPSSVFGFFSPSYKIPGTSINSPEFQIYNNLTLINRSQLLWAIITNQQGGLVLGDGNWLDANFPTIPDLVDALNHLAYHGTMSQAEQARITAVAVQLQNSDPKLARQAAIFLALNNDNFMVVR